MAQAGVKKVKAKKEKQQREAEELAHFEDFNFDLAFDDFDWTGTRINDGSFGLVVPAKHKFLGDVAVKFSFRLADDDLLRKEFRMLARIGQFHPNMVHVFGMVLDPNRRQNLGQPGMVMELMKGGDLHDLIYENRYNYETGHVIGWMMQVLSAICHLHHNGIIHRDVKPRNILLSADFSIVKLCDFGMTRPEQNEMTPAQGSPYWLAPECLHKTYDRKMDVFASAVTMWQLLSRRKPHENKVGSILALLHTDPDVRPERFDCDSALWDLIEKSWCTSTDLRYSALEMLNELQQLAEVYPWPGHLLQSLISPSSSSVNSSRRNSFLAQQIPQIPQNGLNEPQENGNAEQERMMVVSEEVLNDLFEKAAVNTSRLMFEMSTQTDDPNEKTLKSTERQENHKKIDEIYEKIDENEETLQEGWAIESTVIVEKMEIIGEPVENGEEEENKENKETLPISLSEPLSLNLETQMDVDSELSETDHKKFTSEFEDHWGIKADDVSPAGSRIVNEHSTSRRSYSYTLTVSDDSSHRSGSEELERLKGPRKSEQEHIDELNELRLTCQLLREKIEAYEGAERAERTERERQREVEVEVEKKAEEEVEAVPVSENGMGNRLESRSESGFDEKSMKGQSMDPIDMKVHFDRIIQLIVDEEFADFHIEKLDRIRDLLEHVALVLKEKMIDWKQFSNDTTKGWLDVLDGLHSISEVLSSIIATNAACVYQETERNANRASARRFKAGLLICQHTLARRQLSEVRRLLDRETKVMAKQRDFHHNTELAEIYDRMVGLLEKISDLPQKQTTTHSQPTFTSKPIPF